MKIDGENIIIHKSELDNLSKNIINRFEEISGEAGRLKWQLEQMQKKFTTKHISSFRVSLN